MPSRYPNLFQVLIDDNLILLSETLLAAQFKADGAYSLPSNSTTYQPTINWPNYYTAVGADIFSMSEDVGLLGVDYEEVDLVAGYRAAIPTACMFYNEGSISFGDPFNCTPSAAQITAFASHVVPGLGAVGARICPLLRTYTGAYKTAADAAIANPLVSGMVAEVNINPPFYGQTGIPAACIATLAAGKKFFFLTVPNSFSYSYDIENILDYLVANGVNLANPNLYFILAVYNNPAGRGTDIGLHPITVSYPTLTPPGNLLSLQYVVSVCDAYRDRMKGAAAGTYLGNSYLGNYWIEEYPPVPAPLLPRPFGGGSVEVMQYSGGGVELIGGGEVEVL